MTARSHDGAPRRHYGDCARQNIRKGSIVCCCLPRSRRILPGSARIVRRSARFIGELAQATAIVTPLSQEASREARERWC
ncbi:unnamed protein product (plasmid) [Mycetohabitans rhizoxinica HKI 454]|uniref:Uncharacterized protein n=1 Tax=Mycetohabitans rhizoxinica (strain DSM 19002 / CIP 109453 / HKI 454) TaxID=882378 RepID=E5AV66_MYCRK|nr:unnamed protein product [Mycetohabitans rhizoxinica HKI 454]